MPIDDCRILRLPQITDSRGNLTFVEGRNHIPFDIARVYYLYDVPGGSDRGGHAHKRLHQLMVAVAGSFDIRLTDGKRTKTFTLNRPFEGLYICPMIWRDLTNFSSGAVSLVMASDPYDEADYLREFDEFVGLSEAESG
jgi:dTDP-4-dehydrorhamnose 3,5-epimerase-like enzyme